MVTTDMQDNKT